MEMAGSAQIPHCCNRLKACNGKRNPRRASTSLFVMCVVVVCGIFSSLSFLESDSPELPESLPSGSPPSICRTSDRQSKLPDCPRPGHGHAGHTTDTGSSNCPTFFAGPVHSPECGTLFGWVQMEDNIP